MAVPGGLSTPLRRRASTASALVAGLGLVGVPLVVARMPDASPPLRLAIAAEQSDATADDAALVDAACVSYWIQIGAFRDPANAARLVGEAGQLVAGDGGPSLLVVQVEVGGAPLYRVVSGPHDAAAADRRRAVFVAAGVPVSMSTSSIADCPAAPTTTAAPAVTAPPTTAPPPISAESPALTAGMQVQAGAFRSLEFAQRRAAELNAALGAAVVAGEFSVVTVDLNGAPLYRVRSRPHARAEADALLVLVRSIVAEAALVNG